jgi:regulator of cell morphogenesis and NO signaling
MKTIRSPTRSRTWASPRELAGYIVSVHHSYLRLALPQLERLIGRISREPHVPVALMESLRGKFTALADALEKHITKQEQLLYPKIRRLREPVAGGPAAQLSLDDLEELIDEMTQENADVVGLLDEVQVSIGDPRWTTHKRLAAELAGVVGELRADLKLHLSRESKVLFPWVRKLRPRHKLIA